MVNGRSMTCSSFSRGSRGSRTNSSRRRSPNAKSSVVVRCPRPVRGSSRIRVTAGDEQADTHGSDGSTRAPAPRLRDAAGRRNDAAVERWTGKVPEGTEHRSYLRRLGTEPGWRFQHGVRVPEPQL